MYESVYDEIEDYFLRKKEVVVLTKLKSFKNLYVTKMPHAVNPKNIDRPSIIITLEEALFSRNVIPKNPENGGTI